MFKELSRMALAIAFGCFGANAAAAQDAFPSRRLEIVVPFAASGGSDLIARIIADGMAEELGQPAIVLNRPGTGASVALEVVAGAAADGHTIMFTTSAFVMNPIFYPKMSVDVVKDFTPVTQLTSSSGVLIANPSIPAKNVGELVEYLKTDGDSVTVATYGFGSQSHVNMLAFEQQTGLDLYDVAYSGGGPAFAALIAGEAQLLFATLLPALPPIEAGLVNPIGVHSPERVQWLPNAPTFIEGGVDFVHSGFFGFAVKKGTPQAAVDRLQQAAAAVLAKPKVKQLIETQGYGVVGSTPADFDTFLQSERTRWAEVIAKSGLSIEELAR